MGNVYGYCKDCKMELVSRDFYYGPPEICEGCFDAIMADEIEDCTPVICIAELWKEKDTQS